MTHVSFHVALLRHNVEIPAYGYVSVGTSLLHGFREHYDRGREEYRIPSEELCQEGNRAVRITSDDEPVLHRTPVCVASDTSEDFLSRVVSQRMLRG